MPGLEIPYYAVMAATEVKRRAPWHPPHRASGLTLGRGGRPLCVLGEASGGPQERGEPELASIASIRLRSSSLSAPTDCFSAIRLIR